MVVSYADGRIYRIVSSSTEQVYIGSTTQPLSKRMAGHRSDYKSYLANKKTRVTSFDILQYGDATIVLIENFPCASIEELLRRERHWIEITPTCVNKQIPGRTRAEYQLDNRDAILLRKKEYNAANKVRIFDYNADYQAANKDELLRKSREYYEANATVIKAKHAQIVVCACGAEITYGSRFNHRKSKKHLDALAQLAGQADAEPVAQSELDPAA